MIPINIGNQRWTMQKMHVKYKHCHDANSNQFWLTPEWKATRVGFFYAYIDRYVASSKVYKGIQDMRLIVTTQVLQKVTFLLD